MMRVSYPWSRAAALGIVLCLLAVLFLGELGRYTFWDDEAITALGAKGVLRTGWTSVLMDYNNIVAYRGGEIVTGFCDRVDPPLEDYVTAGAFALIGQNPLVGRLPFALMGVAATGLCLAWVRRESWAVFLMVALGIAGNVSLILFCRQCRYYAMSIFLSTAIAYVYWRWKPTDRTLLLLSGLSALLFASNYLQYLALYLCLAIDYGIWKRREWPWSFRRVLLLFGPQALVNGVVAFVWNPLRTQYGGSVLQNSSWDRMTLWWWYWRDMNVAEFICLPLIVLALVAGFVQRKTWMIRGCSALAIYVTFICAVSPQPVSLTSVADIRYMGPIIPLAIALEAGAIWVLLGRWPWLAIAAAVVIFGTNLFNGGPLLDRGFHSTICDYAGELMHPPPEPYTPTADWVNANIPEGGSVWVLPDYATYPLMFRAPRALYAWQLDWPPRPDFANLPRIHFKGQEPPDYLVAFGPFLRQMVETLQGWNRPDVHYNEVATIPVFWRDMYRPELFWRTFTPITGFDPSTQAIYIFKRTRPPITSPAGRP
jgi:hypothetical protein